MLYEQASEAADYIYALVKKPVHVGMILGSGMGPLAELLENPIVVPYPDIPHLALPTVGGHAGQFLVGSLGGLTVACFQGRFHAYEGYSLDVVTFPIRILQRLSAPRVLLTAATGGIRDELAPGSIVCLSDHINLLGVSPLRGPNDARLGPRFPDLTEVYSSRLRALALDEASRLGRRISSGVYACMPGPNYETPAEIAMLRTLGADVVGMSTVPEAIVARHGGQEVLALAVVTNWASGLHPAPLSHEDVLKTSHSALGELAELVRAILLQLASEEASSQTIS